MLFFIPSRRTVLPCWAVIGPGVYRVRPVNQDRLAYIGQTGVSVRQRLGMLCRNTLVPEMPWNDPHTAAPSLWALRDAEAMDFECSGAATDLSQHEREAFECYLLWQYRLEQGTSTLCNHGRFHPRSAAYLRHVGPGCW